MVGSLGSSERSAETAGPIPILANPHVLAAWPAPVRVLVAAVALLLVVGGGARAQHTTEVNRPASIVDETQTIPPPALPDRCIRVVFAEFDDDPQATRYEWQGYDHFRDFPRSAAGPPFDDEFRRTNNIFIAPPGRHRLALTSLSGSCANVAAAALGDITSEGVDVTVPSGPKASFTVTRTRPGEYQLVSTSTDPDQRPLVYEWSFGDGETAEGAVTTHAYAEPGTYTVTHTVTDDTGRKGMATKPIVVKPPALGVDIAFPDAEDTRFEVDEEFTATVTLSADTDGLGDLSDVTFDGEPLELAPDDHLEILSGPTPELPDGLNLARGESITVSFELKALTPGTVSLTSQATASDDAGEPVDGKAKRNVHVPFHVLEVTVEADPSVVELEDGEEGAIPQDVAVTVTVKNIHTEPVESITLASLDPVSREEPPPVPATLVVKDGPTDPAAPENPDASALGTLQPDASITRSYTLEAQDDGDYDVEALVTAADPFGEGTVTEIGSGRVKASGDVILYFKAEAAGAREGGEGEPGGGAPFIPGGHSWRVLGTLANRSEDETLRVKLVPRLTGNAFYALPIEDGTTAPDVHCALGIVRELEPDEEITFTAPVRTLRNGGTRGTVVFEPEGFIFDDETEEWVPLTEEQVFFEDGSTEHVVHVDTRDEAPPAETPVGLLVGHFLVSTVDGLATFAEGIWSLVGLALEAVALSAQPWEWPKAYRAAGDALAKYVTEIHDNLPPADQKAFEDDLLSAVVLATAVTLDEARTLVDTAVEQRLTELTTAWETGDLQAVAGWWGELAGENPDLALQALVAGYGVCKIAHRSARTISVGLEAKAASQAATLEARAAQGVRALRTHDLLDYERHLRNIFGIDRVTDRMLRELTQRWRITVAVRRRGVGVVDKLATGRFTLKPYALKAKNVNAVDIDYLGFPNRLDEVVIKEPPPWSEVLGKLGGADAEKVAEVQERWATRWKEWYGKGAHPETGAGGNLGNAERTAWLSYEAAGIPYSKTSVDGIVDNLSRGFSAPMDDLASAPRRFRAGREIVGTDGRPAWIAEIEDPIKGWQGVTGDIDAVAILRADGTVPDDATRLAIYRALRHLGFQHPEPLTWYANPAGRNAYMEQFSIHNPNSEAMAAYMPDGTVRAARFDPGKSWFDPGNALNAGQIYLRGANVMLNSREPTPTDMSALEDVADQRPPGYISPDSWIIVDPSCSEQGQATPPGTCPLGVEFVSDPDALVLRQSGVGTLERWTAEDGWQPFTWTESIVAVLPQTALAIDAEAGSFDVEILELADLGLDPSTNAWFAAGDLVVINPGGATEEVVHVVSLGSLELAGPLQFDHLAGELVISLGPDPSGTSTTTSVAGTIPSTTSTVAPTTTSTTLTGPASSTTTSTTTSTTAVTGTTTTTLAGEGTPLGANKLLLKQRRARPKTRRLTLVSRDGAGLELPEAAMAAAITDRGGSLRMVAGGDGPGFDVRLELPPAGWAPLSSRRPTNGLRYRSRGSREAEVVLELGERLVVKGRGEALTFDLDAEPGVVDVELDVGGRRYCLQFGGSGSFVPGRKLLRRNAARPDTCPASPAG
jgi:PKD repeat protein